MRKSNQSTIGELLGKFVKENKLDSGLQEVEMISKWKEVVGDYMANHTSEIKINKGILFIQMNSPACREELLYRKTQLIDEINRLFGKKIIFEIVIR
ncbi:MAG: DUF721 domain-containing protein [Bacteroidia bacterium]|nr:DUF721 domain-containing protein [Bacteroidia bacterium]